eukprot:6173348-Pleurochrysis_carterae.AAC.7
MRRRNRGGAKATAWRRWKAADSRSCRTIIGEGPRAWQLEGLALSQLQRCESKPGSASALKHHMSSKNRALDSFAAFAHHRLLNWNAQLADCEEMAFYAYVNCSNN